MVMQRILTNIMHNKNLYVIYILLKSSLFCNMLQIHFDYNIIKFYSINFVVF